MVSPEMLLRKLTLVALHRDMLDGFETPYPTEHSKSHSASLFLPYFLFLF